MAKARKEAKYHEITDEDLALMKEELTRRKKLDPALKTRKLTATPKVHRYDDLTGVDSTVRILTRQNAEPLPEFGLFVKASGYHVSQPFLDMLDAAGFTYEDRGKWVLRTNKFNIFVYV